MEYQEVSEQSRDASGARTLEWSHGQNQYCEMRSPVLSFRIPQKGQPFRGSGRRLEIVHAARWMDYISFPPALWTLVLLSFLFPIPPALPALGRRAPRCPSARFMLLHALFPFFPWVSRPQFFPMRRGYEESSRLVSTRSTIFVRWSLIDQLFWTHASIRFRSDYFLWIYDLFH